MRKIAIDRITLIMIIPIRRSLKVHRKLYKGKGKERMMNGTILTKIDTNLSTINRRMKKMTMKFIGSTLGDAERKH